MITRRAAVAALAALVAACSYSYSNPAQGLRAGEVAGRVTAPSGGAAAARGGVIVSLRGSAFELVSHDTGRFDLRPLPEGTHTLLFRDATGLAGAMALDLPWGRDGQAEGVALGDVALARGARVTGSVTPASRLGMNPGGVVVDELTGATALVQGGSFAFPALGPGRHRLLLAGRDDDSASATYGTVWVGGPVELTLTEADALTDRTLTQVLLADAAGPSGRLRFHLGAVGVSIDPATFTVRVADASLAAQAVPAPDSRGDVELPVAPGIYFVWIAAPSAAIADAPPPAVAVVLPDRLTDLGTLYLVSPAAVVAAQATCAGPADCGGAACEQGLCAAGWTPPGIPRPVCSLSSSWCYGADGAACALPDGFPGVCRIGPSAVGNCVPCGTCCVTDHDALDVCASGGSCP